MRTLYCGTRAAAEHAEKYAAEHADNAEAGIADHVWSIEELAGLLDALEKKAACSDTLTGRAEPS